MYNFIFEGGSLLNLSNFLVCQMEFLFLNEFKRHLMSNHKQNNFLMCGYEKCQTRVAVEKMTAHWSQVHGISLYQCGLCKTSTTELKLMYYHFAKYHQGSMVDILIRMITPLQVCMSKPKSSSNFLTIIHKEVR